MSLYNFQYVFIVGNQMMYGSLLLQIRKRKLVNEDFGLQIQEGLTTVDARVLPSPTVILLLFVCLNYLAYIIH